MPAKQSYREIPLTQGQVAIVDAEDFDRINQSKWCSYWNSHTQSFYAIRGIVLPTGKHETVYMHREILGLKKGDPRTGDHRFHNTLDNRRFISSEINLRIATRTENIRNRRKYRKNKTGFKGVSEHGNGRYRATIWTGDKNKIVGVCDTPEAAHALYCEEADRLHGEFSHH